MDGMSTKRKLFITLAVVVVVAVMGIFGTFAAFTATTTNSGNQISAGTVKIDQHAGATSLYNLAAQTGGQSYSACVRVTYSGSLASNVKLYSSAITGDTSAFTLNVERGTGLSSPGASMSCTGFSSGVSIFNNTLNNFPTTQSGGLEGKAGGAAWNTGDSVDYKFTITTNDGASANDHATAKSLASHSFTWEARNN